MLTEADIAMSDTGKIRELAKWVGTIERRLNAPRIIIEGKAIYYDAKGNVTDVTPMEAHIDNQARDLPENTLRTWDEICRAKALVAEFDKLTCQLGADWKGVYDKLLAENKELKTEIVRLRKGESFADTT